MRANPGVMKIDRLKEGGIPKTILVSSSSNKCQGKGVRVVLKGRIGN